MRHKCAASTADAWTAVRTLTRFSQPFAEKHRCTRGAPTITAFERGLRDPGIPAEAVHPS